MKHTPWKTGNARTISTLPQMINVTEIVGSDGEIIAVAIFNDGNGSQAKNAALIAAAPDLLACCKLALPLLQEYRERVIKGEIAGHLLTADYGPTRDMEAAISKAEGGE